METDEYADEWERIASSPCPCGSDASYEDCCQPFHRGHSKPATAEQLMRSRYSAYAYRQVDYLIESYHPSMRSKRLREDLIATIQNADWIYLRILSSSGGKEGDKQGKVAFVAGYFMDGEQLETREHSRFRRFEGDWKYYDDGG